MTSGSEEIGYEYKNVYNEMKIKSHNILEPIGTMKVVIRGNFKGINAYDKK
jgi:hypothetical protein